MEINRYKKSWGFYIFVRKERGHIVGILMILEMGLLIKSNDP